MSSRSFDFLFGDRKCWAQAHANRHPSVTLALRTGSGLMHGSLDVTLSMSPTECRAMAVALEAAATFAENVLETGLGESAADAAPTVSA